MIVLLAGAGTALALTGSKHAGTPHAPVALSTRSGQPSGRSAPRASGRQTGAPERQAELFAAPGRRQSIREIDHVLAYTPFLVAGAGRHRVIALTFDDGPSPYTPAIVRVLVRMRVPATFFVVGQQLRYFAGGLRDELRHGFQIGDHTRNHAWLPRLSAAAQDSQISGDADELQRFGAPRPLLFRPPYGSYDAVTLRILRAMHMLMVMWSVDPGDWRRPGTASIVRTVLAGARSGAVVIMHDGGGDRSQTVAALPQIIRGLRRRHYDLVTIDRLLALDPPPHHQRLPGLGAA